MPTAGRRNTGSNSLLWPLLLPYADTIRLDDHQKILKGLAGEYGKLSQDKLLTWLWRYNVRDLDDDDPRMRRCVDTDVTEKGQKAPAFMRGMNGPLA